MKITLNHEKLSKALNYSSKAASSKPNIPVLSNVLLEVNKNGIKLSATNLEMGINMWIPGVVETEGRTTVSAKFIADFVAASSSEKVDLELKNDVLFVKTESSKASFNTIPSQEFPVLPKLAETPLFRISAKEFITTMEKVLFSCSTDMSAGRLQQTGVLFELNKENSDEITFVGLDGFRLSLRKTKISDLNINENVENMIIPAKYVAEVVKILQDNAEIDTLEVFLSEIKSQVVFKIEEIEFSIRLLEGPYPDYKRILPDSASYTFFVEKAELDRGLKIINTFARTDLSNRTLFDFNVEDHQLKLKSAVSEIGENETAMMLENVEGASDLNTAFNLRYLQDLVNHVKGDKIIFESKGSSAAAVFKDKADASFLHLIMPLRREN